MRLLGAERVDGLGLQNVGDFPFDICCDANLLCR